MPEIAYLRRLQREGFNSVCWVSSYGGRRFRVDNPTGWGRGSEVEPPAEVLALLRRIWALGKTTAACFDLVAVRDGVVHFFELNRHNKDRPTEGQLRFITAGHALGLRPDQLTFVEWSLLQ